MAQFYAQNKWACVDLTQDKAAQKEGYDYRVTYTAEDIRTVDVKTDSYMHKSGCVALEMSDGGRLGCAMKTQAYEWHVLEKHGTRCVVLDMQSTRHWLRHNYGQFRRWDVVNTRYGKTWKTWGVLVPLETLDELGFVLTTWVVPR